VNARLFAMPGAGPFARSVAANVPLERGELTTRRFPDGETYVRVESDVTRRDCVVVADLARPDEKVVPLLLVATTLRDLGARRVGLVAPYLPYLRQDARFAAGEGITSVYFARWISGAFDWLCTVDPHLHRHPTLAAVYSIPAEVVAAAPRIAAWIRREVAAPLLVGPDEESTQWVAQVAASAGAPFVVAAKRRHGDRDVEIDLPDLAAHRGRTPVLVDDIASTARTMVAVARQLTERGRLPPICIAVHGLFAGAAFDELRAAGVARIASCNTVHHPSNEIDVAPDVAAAVERWCRGGDIVDDVKLEG